MKKFIFYTVLSCFVVSSNILRLNAQSLDNNVYLAFHTSKELTSYNDDKEIRKESILNSSGELSRYAQYMMTEQFVFDNLKVLKQHFSADDIYFDLDDSTILPDASQSLDNLVNLLSANPALKVAITSHADSRVARYNVQLTLARSNSAKAYLKSKGIDESRIEIEKFGRPTIENICDNDPTCSLEAQRLNRKTEFNIIFNGINLGQVH